MFSFSIVSNPESFNIDESRVHHIFDSISKNVKLPQNGIINIGFLSDSEIQHFNKEYRGIDKNTDVLSFHYFDSFGDTKKDDIVGEIIMSESKIMEQALQHHHSQRTEFEILAIHGILHILGFDHESDEEYTEMWYHEEPIRKIMETL